MYSLLNSHHTTVLASVLYNPDCPGLELVVYYIWHKTTQMCCYMVWVLLLSFMPKHHTHPHLKLHTTVDTTGNEPIVQNVQTNVLLEYS